LNQTDLVLASTIQIDVQRCVLTTCWWQCPFTSQLYRYSHCVCRSCHLQSGLFKHKSQ